MISASKPRYAPLLTVILVLASSAANVLGAFLMQRFNIPLYLDSFCSFAGPALATAALTNSALALVGLLDWPFLLCHLLSVLGAWPVFRMCRGSDVSCFLWAGLLSAVSNGIVGTGGGKQRERSPRASAVGCARRALHGGTSSVSHRSRRGACGIRLRKRR